MACPQGNLEFKAGEYKKALASYQEALDSVSSSGDVNIQTSLHSNIGLCHMKLGNLEAARDSGTAGLRLDPMHEKCLYRRAMAFEGLGKFQDALRDLKSILSAHPKNKLAKQAAIRMRDQLSDSGRKDRQISDFAAQLSGKEGEEKQLSALRSVCGGASNPDFVRNLERGSAIKTISALLQQPASHPSYLPSLRALVAVAHHNAEAVRRSIPPLNSTALLPCIQHIVKTGDWRKEDLVDCACTAVALLGLLANGEEGGTYRPSAFRAFLTVCPHDGTMISSDKLILAALGLCSRTLVSHDSAVSFVREKGHLSLFRLGNHLPIRQETIAALAQLFSVVEGKDQVEKQAESLVYPSVASENTVDQIRGCVVLLALFLSAKDVASTMIQQETVLANVTAMLKDHDGDVQAVALEVLNYAVIEESTRATLSAVGVPLLKALTSSADPQLRSLAVLVLSKLDSVPKKSPDSGLSVSSPEEAASKGSSRVLDSDELGSLLTTIAELLESPKTRERGIECLSSLSDRLPVKQALVAGDARLLQVLTNEVNAIADQVDKQARAAEQKGLESDVPAKALEKSVMQQLQREFSLRLLGLSHIFCSLTTSLRAKNEERVQEMDISLEEFRKFQQLARSARPGDDEMDMDTEERVAERISVYVSLPFLVVYPQNRLLKTGALPSLLKLGKHAAYLSLATKANLGAVFLNVVGPGGSPAPSRIEMVRCGGVPVLLKLAAGGGDCAPQALARILISTNPAVLPDAVQMQAVSPLLELARNGRPLAKFEAAMALTNLASVGDELKSAIARKKGVDILQWVQFDDHPLLRRAGTEALSNLLPEELVMNKCFRDKDRLGLWLGLAASYEEDVATAMAAMGALAMAAGDEAVARLLIAREDGMSILTEVMATGVTDLQHRVIVLLLNMMAVLPDETPPAVLRACWAEEEREPIYLFASILLVSRSGESPAKEAAEQLLSEVQQSKNKIKI